MSQWHEMAREMVEQGEHKRAVAQLFGVSEPMIHRIMKAPPPRRVDIPEWVQPQNRTSFRVLAMERGIGVAIAWTKKVQGS